MKLQTKKDFLVKHPKNNESSKTNESIFSKDYIDFLNEAGWRLERKLPSNNTNYSDLLEDTDWKSNDINLRSSIHYRRDLDALS